MGKMCTKSIRVDLPSIPHENVATLKEEKMSSIARSALLAICLLTGLCAHSDPAPAISAVWVYGISTQYGADEYNSNGLGYSTQWGHAGTTMDFYTQENGYGCNPVAQLNGNNLTMISQTSVVDPTTGIVTGFRFQYRYSGAYLSGGTFTFQDTSANSPWNTASTTLNVLPYASAAITTASPVTTGTTGHVASVPSQPGAAIVWSITGGTITSGAGTNSIKFTAGAVGTLKLTCTVGMSGASDTESANVTVVAAPVATITATTPVTTGSTGNAASVPSQSGCTYVWTVTGGTVTSGAGTYTIKYTAGAVGTLTLKCTVTNAAATAATGSKSISVVPNTTITAASPVTTLTTGIKASVPTQTGATYLWTLTGGTMTAGSTTNALTYTAGAVGTATLTCKVTTSGVSATGTKSVSVIAAPVATITATTPVVTGSTGNAASVPSQSGCTYVWTVTGGTVTSGAGTYAIKYTAGAVGTLTLKCTVTNAAATAATGSKSISVVPNTTITASSPVTTLTTGHTASVPVQTGSTYVWSLSSGSITNGTGTNQITYTAGAVGTLTITCTVTTSSVPATGTKSVSVIAAPVATITATTPVKASSTGNVACG